MDSNFGLSNTGTDGAGAHKGRRGNMLEESSSSEDEHDDLEEGQQLDMLQDRKVLGDDEEEDQGEDHIKSNPLKGKASGAKANWDEESDDNDLDDADAGRTAGEDARPQHARARLNSEISMGTSESQS